eukprot:scaffold3221_cov118-Isochrysis_galbana.AAC.7
MVVASGNREGQPAGLRAEAPPLHAGHAFSRAGEVLSAQRGACRHCTRDVFSPVRAAASSRRSTGETAADPPASRPSGGGGGLRATVTETASSIPSPSSKSMSSKSSSSISSCTRTARGAPPYPPASLWRPVRPAAGSRSPAAAWVTRLSNLHNPASPSWQMVEQSSSSSTPPEATSAAAFCELSLTMLPRQNEADRRTSYIGDVSCCWTTGTPPSSRTARWTSALPYVRLTRAMRAYRTSPSLDAPAGAKARRSGEARRSGGARKLRSCRRVECEPYTS